MNQNQIVAALQGIMPQAYAGGWFPSLCTIQVPTATVTESGAPANTWTNYAGLVAIPCEDAPSSVARIQATEVKDLEEIMAKSLRSVLLNGCYQELVILKYAGQLRALITGPDGNTITYEVMGVEDDSSAVQTRFVCQKVSL